MNPKPRQMPDLNYAARQRPLVPPAQLAAEVHELSRFTATLRTLRARGVPDRKVADFFVCSPEAVNQAWK